MVPSIEDILTRIPPPANTEKILCDIQTAEDIVACVLNSVRISKPYTNRYAFLFMDSNKILQACEDVYDFMRENFDFNPETGHKQTGRSVRYIIYDPDRLNKKYFDCKHYSTFAIATLRGCGINCSLRLCGYTKFNNNPTHIYVIAKDEGGNDIIVDGTLPYFNKESKSAFKINIEE